MNVGPTPTPAEECEESEVRCHCGRLLARFTPQGLELKCTRCKARRVIPIEAIDGHEHLARRASRLRPPAT